MPHVLTVSPAFDPDLVSEDALLTRYETLTGWAEAVLGAGASRVTVVQRFSRDARLERAGVSYVFVSDGDRPLPRSIARLPRLADAVARESPDVVHVNGLLFPGLLPTLRRRLPLDVPLLVQHHGGGPPGRLVTRLVARRGLSIADAFLFSTVELAEPWRQARLIGDAQPVHDVLESSTRMAPVEASTLQGSPRLLWVGRLDANKDPLTVLAGLADALSALPGAHLTMVHGTDTLKKEVEERALREDLRGRVTLLGPVDHAHLPHLYSSADLFVLGSHQEGSGYALMEALACGAYPVVTDIPPFRLILGNGESGELWAKGRPDSFAAALLRAAAHRRDRVALRASFLARCGWPAVGRRALQIYVRAREARRPRTR